MLTASFCRGLASGKNPWGQSGFVVRLYECVQRRVACHVSDEHGRKSSNFLKLGQSVRRKSLFFVLALSLSSLEKFHRYLRKKGICDFVFFIFQISLDVVRCLFQCWFKHVGWTTGYGLFVPDDFLLDCWVDGCWRFAVEASHVIFYLFGNYSVAFA